MRLPSSGWWFHATHGASGSLADFRGKRVGIVAGTVAISEKDHSVIKFKSREELLGGFAAAALDAAFVDADFAAWYLHEHPQLELAAAGRLCAARALEHGPGGAGQGRSSFCVEINRVLGQLAESGELRRIYDALRGAVSSARFRESLDEKRRVIPGAGFANGAS